MRSAVRRHRAARLAGLITAVAAVLASGCQQQPGVGEKAASAGLAQAQSAQPAQDVDLSDLPEHLHDELARESADVVDVLRRLMQALDRRDWARAEAALRDFSQLKPRKRWPWRFVCISALYIARQQEDTSHEYAWMKRGISVLLNALEYEPDDADILWETALVFHTRMFAHHPTELRRHFANDLRFHEVLKRFVDLEQARGIDGNPDSYLVAWLFYEQAAAALAYKHRLADGGTLPDGFPLADYYNASQASWPENERLREFQRDL